MNTTKLEWCSYENEKKFRRV